MSSRSPSKQRLEELIALARTYRGWSSKELARELGRDVHHLVPESGVPKLDIVIALADALDWTVQDVVDDLCGNVPARTDLPTESWAELDRAAHAAHCEGRFEDMIAIANRELDAAVTSEQRAWAYGRQFLAWESSGCYVRAADAAQRGLAESGLSPEVTLHLRNHLANAHYLLGRTLEAEGVATCTLGLIDSGELQSRYQFGATGFAHYVRGNARRVLAGLQDPTHRHRAESALEDLLRAVELCDREFAINHVTGHALNAHIARGAIVEVEAMLGIRTDRDALDRIVTELDSVIDVDRSGEIGLLEGYGWWCIFGCNVALRASVDHDECSRLMGVFTNKADEIAERLGNWSLRERVWTLELARRAAADGIVEGEWVVDAEDVRQISGAMARFPRFRPDGWKVLRAVRIQDLDKGSS